MPLQSDHYFNVLELALRHYQQGDFAEALALIREGEELNKIDFALLHVAALCSFRLGNIALAKSYIEKALALSPEDASSWNVLGEVLRLSGNLLEAIQAFQKAIAYNPSLTDAYSNLGNVYADANDYENATAAYSKAISLDQNHIDAWYNLGNVALKAKRFSAALEAYRKVLSLNSQHLGALNNYGLLLGDLKQYAEVQEVYERLLSLRPDFSDAVLNYANIIHASGKLRESSEILSRFLPGIPKEHSVPHLLRQGGILRELGERLPAKEAYLEALRIDSTSKDAIRGVINMDIELGNFIAARERITSEHNKNPDDLHIQFARCFLELPVVYSDEEEIVKVRGRYEEQLGALEQRVLKLPSENISFVEDIIGSSQPFFLPYQALDNRELQMRYGALIAPLLQRALPVPPLTQRAPIKGRRIRVGIVSGFFRNHSNYKIPVRGWLQNIDRSRFEIFGYHTQPRIDESTQEASTLCAKFIQGPKPLREWVQLISQDELDVLIFPEIGMDPMTCRLACLRLAPHQATSWGHPETSGIPTIDYFLSSDLMEPSDGEKHYSEKLIRLPKLSFSYEPPKRHILPLTRKDVGIRNGAFAYWCCQTNYKYLPQFDWVFPEIATAVPHAQFIFIQIQPQSEASGILRKRLDEAFARKGLQASTFVTYLEALDADRFATVASLCDVALDSFEWSGCNSSLETLAQGTPIITCPGTFMRGRHTSAVLEMIGCEEMIAKNPTEWVSLAIELSRDSERLANLRAKVTTTINQAFRDIACIRGLEDTLITWNADEGHLQPTDITH
jgi:predicted O-linked N-acetylglucosamine transferase (SPINDLY family)